MSFFVSKNIEGILDEETLRNQSDQEGKSTTDTEFCKLAIVKEDDTSFFKIKKVKFLKKHKTRKVMEISFNCKAKLIGSVISNSALVSNVVFGNYSVKIVSADILSIESSGIGEYSVVINCLSE